MVKQERKQSCQKIIVTSFARGSLTLILSLSFFQVSAFPALAQSAASNPRQVLTEEIKSLARSDVENDIPRRTNFVVQLYSQNAAGVKAPESSRIYDETYSQQIKQKNVHNALLVLLVLVLLGLLAAYLLKRNTRFRVKKVSTSLPFGLGQVELESDEAMRRAAWSLYVELTTRIATQDLDTNQGLLREALNSLYSLFAITRQILREAGPDVGASRASVGGIAIAVLNVGLRPFLTKWHPALSAWEAQRPTGAGPKEHEKNWSEEPQLRNELKLLRENLEQYVHALTEVIGITK